MKYRRLVVLALLLMVSQLLSSCSGDIDESVYRYQDANCPLSEPARNLRVYTLKGVVLVVTGRSEASPVAMFNLGGPGKIGYGDVAPDFAMEKLELCGSCPGVLWLQQGYLHFGEDEVLPVQIADTGGQRYRTMLTFPCLDLPGSENIRVVNVIGAETTRTKLAGLSWTTPGLISIRDDGIVTVDREGRKAVDEDGNVWITVWNRKIKGYVMVKDE